MLFTTGTDSVKAGTFAAPAGRCWWWTSQPRRNAVPGELLVRLRPDKIVAMASVAG
ncbi:MAG TPA: hypothetical protein VFO16_07610 [Pseudonocardiaceae bacterium]|nr:hypothetical protein [Pseudonocardiaceae bacterium]